MKNKRYVEYEPPPAELIDTYAKDVCKKIGESDPEVIYGFARFLRFAAVSISASMTRNVNNEDTKNE